jgi:hypothetical protein
MQRRIFGLTLSQRRWTSLSASCLQDIRLSIQPSRVGTVAGSVCTGDTSAGALPASSILVSMLDIRVVERSIEGYKAKRKGAELRSDRGSCLREAKVRSRDKRWGSVRSWGGVAGDTEASQGARRRRSTRGRVSIVLICS